MKIVVDLTPLLPGVQSVGVKPFVLHLLRGLIATAPEVQFVLLTSYTTDAELASLDAPNATRRCVDQPPREPTPTTATTRTNPRFSSRRRVRLALSRVLPTRLMVWIERAYLAIGRRPTHVDLPRTLGGNLLFSPFTTSSFQQPGFPSVSLVHDVRFLQYPRFCSPDQRAANHRALHRAARLSSRLVCPSAFVERIVRDNVEVAPAKVVTIQPQSFSRLTTIDEQAGLGVLARLELERETFLLYPATFAPDHNHAMLLTAFNVFQTAHPDARLRLVCPGPSGPTFDEMLRTALAMRLEARVVFPGFIGDAELVALYQNCRAVIVPSLYEGFGLAVMEALAFHRPLLCPDYAGLRELAGAAAVYFDPHLLSDVVAAIERAAIDPALLQRLAGASAAQFAAHADSAGMARQYLRVFAEAAA